ncbi:hypothetical protein RHMOL_Rhmol12G0226200 [Rhododendron molle]|uniref:Uncharacterized protein n=1 Tax=Rhododendron molle TaxID=49168 RepID=A0ACC0LM38_RHOML|nr:hypothetical protein RHMOL_Rhmol12G0226200 [Rhododendron molle]
MWGRRRLRKEAMMGSQESVRKRRSSGCLGSLCKLELINSNEPPKGPKLQGRRVSKPSISEDFWTTSACDMDNSAVLSRGSISSISTSTLPIDPHGTSSGNTPSEFVNHGKFLLSFMLTTLFGLGGTCTNLHNISLHAKNMSPYLMLNMVGVGLLLWNQTRQQWIGTKKPNIHTQQLREPKISWNATYESLLGSNKPFSQRIPLSVSFFLFGEEFFQSGLITLLGNALCIFGCNEQEMIDFLSDIWEQEGLYD